MDVRPSSEGCGRWRYPLWYLTSPSPTKPILQVVLELGEDVLQRFGEDVGQYVEPATVRHPDDEVASSAAAPVG